MKRRQIKDKKLRVGCDGFLRGVILSSWKVMEE